MPDNVTTQAGTPATLPAGVSIATKEISPGVHKQIVEIDNDIGTPIPVSGPATDAQMRAAPIPVSVGEIEIKNDAGNPVPVSGPLTDVQLRAVALPVAIQNASLEIANDVGNPVPISNPALNVGRQAAAQSVSVVLATEDSDALLVTGAPNLAVINALLTPATNVTKYRFASVHVVATATAGQYIFEGSNNNVDWVPLRLQEIGNDTFASSVVVSPGSRIFHGAISTRFFQVRISTALTGGVAQAFTQLEQVGTENTYKPMTDAQLRATALNISEVPASRTPTLARATAAGTVAVNARFASISNVGNANGTLLGAVLKPGETVDIEAGAQKDLLGVIAYDATGTEFLVLRVG